MWYVVAEVQIKEHFSTSDHNIMVWQLKCDTTTRKSEKKLQAMNEWLRKVDWNDRLAGFENSIDEMWDRFVNTINEAVIRFVPVSENKRRCGIWITRKASRARRNKMMWERYKESKSYNDYTEYKRVLNKATKEYRKAKVRKYERTMILKRIPKLSSPM